MDGLVPVSSVQALSYARRVRHIQGISFLSLRPSLLLEPHLELYCTLSQCAPDADSAEPHASPVPFFVSSPCIGSLNPNWEVYGSEIPTDAADTMAPYAPGVRGAALATSDPACALTDSALAPGARSSLIVERRCVLSVYSRYPLTHPANAAAACAAGPLPPPPPAVAGDDAWDSAGSWHRDVGQYGLATFAVSSASASFAPPAGAPCVSQQELMARHHTRAAAAAAAASRHATLYDATADDAAADASGNAADVTAATVSRSAGGYSVGSSTAGGTAASADGFPGAAGCTIPFLAPAAATAAATVAIATTPAAAAAGQPLQPAHPQLLLSVELDLPRLQPLRELNFLPHVLAPLQHRVVVHLAEGAFTLPLPNLVAAVPASHTHAHAQDENAAAAGAPPSPGLALALLPLAPAVDAFAAADAALTSGAPELGAGTAASASAPAPVGALSGLAAALGLALAPHHRSAASGAAAASAAAAAAVAAAAAAAQGPPSAFAAASAAAAAAAAAAQGPVAPGGAEPSPSVATLTRPGTAGALVPSPPVALVPVPAAAAAARPPAIDVAVAAPTDCPDVGAEAGTEAEADVDAVAAPVTIAVAAAAGGPESGDGADSTMGGDSVVGDGESAVVVLPAPGARAPKVLAAGAVVAAPRCYATSLGAFTVYPPPQPAHGPVPAETTVADALAAAAAAAAASFVHTRAGADADPGFPFVPAVALDVAGMGASDTAATAAAAASAAAAVAAGSGLSTPVTPHFGTRAGGPQSLSVRRAPLVLSASVSGTLPGRPPLPRVASASAALTSLANASCPASASTVASAGTAKTPGGGPGGCPAPVPPSLVTLRSAGYSRTVRGSTALGTSAGAGRSATLTPPAAVAAVATAATAGGGAETPSPSPSPSPSPQPPTPALMSSASAASSSPALAPFSAAPRDPEAGAAAAACADLCALSPAATAAVVSLARPPPPRSLPPAATCSPAELRWHTHAVTDLPSFLSQTTALVHQRSLLHELASAAATSAADADTVLLKLHGKRRRAAAPAPMSVITSAPVSAPAVPSAPVLVPLQLERDPVSGALSVRRVSGTGSGDAGLVVTASVAPSLAARAAQAVAAASALAAERAATARARATVAARRAALPASFAALADAGTAVADSLAELAAGAGPVLELLSSSTLAVGLQLRHQQQALAAVLARALPVTCGPLGDDVRRVIANAELRTSKARTAQQRLQFQRLLEEHAAATGRQTWALRGLPVMGSRLFVRNADPPALEALSVALGYAVQMVILLSRYFGIPLRYRLAYRGSRSVVYDDVHSPHGFPLFLLPGAGADAEHRFFQALALLNKDVELVCETRIAGAAAGAAAIAAATAAVAAGAVEAGGADAAAAGAGAGTAADDRVVGDAGYGGSTPLVIKPGRLLENLHMLLTYEVPAQ